MVWRCSAWVNPGSTVRSAWNVRIISPALTSSTSAMATWATTRRLRARWRSRLTLAVRPALRRASGNPRPGIFQRRDQSEQQAREQRKSQREPERPGVEGDFAQARQIRRTNGHQEAQARIGEPDAEHAADEPEHTLSTSSSRTIRPHPAPSAARTASSCCRASALTSNKFVDVGAGDQHHHADGPHHHPQDVADIADHFLFQRTKRGRDSPGLINSRIAAGAVRPGVHPDRQQARQVGIGLCDGRLPA